jgi:hypothetical protein
MKKLSLVLTLLLALMAGSPLSAAPQRPALTRVLFLYGSVPPGTGPSEMIHIDNTGRNGYAQLAAMLLWEQGHNVTEIADTDPAVNPLTANALNGYDLVVFGSNNRRFSSAEAQAAGDYVRGGGALLVLSDSQFGPSPNRSQNALGAGELSDNDIIGQFGMYIEHDNYQVVVADAARFAQPAHPILAGVTSFKGEGVSLIRVDGPPASIVVRGNGLPLTDGHTITGKNYAITAVAQVGEGRVAVTFDRNTFFNAGVGSDGTDIGELDNRTYALNLFDWLTRQRFTQPTGNGIDSDLCTNLLGRR